MPWVGVDPPAAIRLDRMADVLRLLPPRDELGRHDRTLLIIGLCLLLVVTGIGWALLAERTRGPARWLDLSAGTEPTVADRLWLATGTVPEADGVDPELVSRALLDLRTLGREHGVPVAGWHPHWHYVWPRDSSLVAVAYARTGHRADAERVLDFLQQMQPESGLFAARYRPDGSGVPDDRPGQLDGLGWALWGLTSVADELPPGERTALLERYRTMLDRSTTAALRLIDHRGALPPASPDYWEVRESRPTLATAALLSAGLRAGATAYAGLGDTERAAAATAGRERLDAAIRRGFGPDRYPRRLGGRGDSVDLGVAFLLPPYAADAAPDVVAAWRAAPEVMRRPAGGLAPGGSWRRDGISWTNITASYAMTAAAIGDHDTARHWLDWLARHRAPNGSLPEKVLADGSPASVAPLAWTAAAVVITTDTLARGH